MTKQLTFSARQLEALRLEYAKVQTVPAESLKKFHELFDNCSDAAIKQLAQAKIRFVSSLALNVCIKRKIKLDQQ